MASKRAILQANRCTISVGITKSIWHGTLAWSDCASLELLSQKERSIAVYVCPRTPVRSYDEAQREHTVESVHGVEAGQDPAQIWHSLEP